MTAVLPTPTPAAGPLPAPHPTAGQALLGDPVVRDSVEAIVRQVDAARRAIVDIRPPRAELKVCYDELMARAAAVRGRGLLYPYVGSGIGNGALVELADGRVMWDMITGIGVHFFGHSEPDLIRECLLGSIDDTLKHGNLLSGFDAYGFMETLIALAARGSRLRHGYLTTSGCMANENALKVCYQKHQPASRVIAFQDCFMGRSVTMAQIGDAAANRVGIPLSTLVDYMPFYDEAAAKQIGQQRYIDMCAWHLESYIKRYPGQHACFIFELVQGEGGFNTAPREFFVRLMDICKQHNIAVWDDEIQTFGRTASMFAYEAMDLGAYVDVFCVGKLTQACATLFTPEYNPQPGLLSGTFTGETSSFRVGRRVLERLRDGGASGPYYGPTGSIARHHALFRQQVEALAARHPAWFPPAPGILGHAGGTGGMMRFSPFGGNKDMIVKACKACFDAGVILFYCGHGPYHIRMLPPLGVMNEADWPRVFATIEQGLAAVAG